MFNALLEIGAKPIGKKDSLPSLDEEMVIEYSMDFEVDIEHDAAEGGKLIMDKTKANKKKELSQKAQKRGIPISVLESEIRRQKQNIEVDPNAGVTTTKGAHYVFFEGDGDINYEPYDFLGTKTDVDYGIYGENKFYNKC